jgi:hypothetical protein
VSTPDAAEIQRIETALQEWRQGDATLDDGTFLVHLADKRTPLTAAARASVDDVPVEFNLYEVLTSVTGLAVVSQSCDIVKKCADCEYVDVSPLVTIDVAAQLQAIRKGQQLRYAYLPGLAPQNLVVDIGRTMTVEKAVLAGWNRIPGCITDQDRVDFADALARKRQRFAFPDIFNAGLTKFRNRIKEKEGKASAEGALIAALDQIRVQPNADWNAPRIAVSFWFLLEPNANTEINASSRSIIETWVRRITLSPPFSLADPQFYFVERRDMTLEDYMQSYRLDYDDLSP